MASQGSGSSKLEEQARGSGAHRSPAGPGGPEGEPVVLDQGEGSPDQSRPETDGVVLGGRDRGPGIVAPASDPRSTSFSLGTLGTTCASPCLGLLVCEGRVIMRGESQGPERDHPI